MNKTLKRAIIREINNLEKNYSKKDVEIIENLLKQVYDVIKAPVQYVSTKSN